MTLTLGSWVIPLAATLATFAWMAWPRQRQHGSHNSMTTLGLEYMVEGLADAFRFAVASIISLLAWLVWALVH